MSNFPRSTILENKLTQIELASSKNRERAEIDIKNQRMSCPEVPKVKTVCLDARMIEHSGIGTYLKNLIPFLAQGNFKLQLILPSSYLERYSYCDAIACDAPIYSIEEQWRLPLLIPSCDLFWSPNFNVPLAPIRAKSRLVTIHDVYYLAYAHTLSWPKRIYTKIMIEAAVKLSDLIVTDSRFSVEEINRYTSAKPEKIIPIYPGIAQSSLPVDGSVRQKYQLPENFLLFVSTFAPHKNILRLLQALDLLRQGGVLQQWKLILVGRRSKANDWEEFLHQNPLLQEHVVILENVGSEDLIQLYRLAKVAVHPSYYEGFGFPPLEAMSLGCPVVVSNAASLPEVCGDAVIYVDPFSVDSIAAGLQQMISSEKQREELKLLGHKQSKAFSWDKTVQQHLEVIHCLVDKDLVR